MAVALSLLGACGGDDGDAGPTGVPLEELPESYAAALCEAYVGCYGTLYAIFRPGEECVKNLTVQLQEELATLPHAVESGSIVYDGVAAQACLDEIAAGGCETLDQRASATCQAVFVGSAAEDADCELDEECEAGLYCSIGDTCPGTCTPLEAAGRACKANSQCKSGLTCGTTGLCVAPAKLGEPCKQGEPDCSGGSICLGDSAANSTPGECVAVDDAFSGEAGDACNFTELCVAGLSCEITSIVMPLSGSCVVQVDADGPCHPALPDECPDDQYCQIDSLFDGTCTPRPEAGMPCAKGIGATADVCAAYARCEEGTCREIATAGEGCTENDTCYSGRCQDGACVAGTGCE
ncbi:MAG TPA: Dickkopf N-terminal cysteine-rich domain-containing protein [Polyangiaceae bacterium]